MKNINTKISTRGILLGASLLGATVIGSVSSAQAAPQGQRHDVKEARQDVRDARQNVREERHDLRDARQDLKVERRDLRNERQDLYRPAPAFINSNRTLEGRVSNDLKDNGVLLRTSNGQEVRVTFANGEPKQLGTGDVVRVSGVYSGNGFLARNVTIIRNN